MNHENYRKPIASRRILLCSFLFAAACQHVDRAGENRPAADDVRCKMILDFLHESDARRWLERTDASLPVFVFAATSVKPEAPAVELDLECGDEVYVLAQTRAMACDAHAIRVEIVGGQPDACYHGYVAWVRCRGGVPDGVGFRVGLYNAGKLRLDDSSGNYLVREDDECY